MKRDANIFLGIFMAAVLALCLWMFGSDEPGWGSLYGLAAIAAATWVGELMAKEPMLAGRNLPCMKCGGRGWYQYDDIHSKPCEDCCTHSQGVWALGEYHSRPGYWCCREGCGKTWPTRADYFKERDEILARRGLA